MPTAGDFERVLRGVTPRVTRARVAVLSAMHAHPHADTDSIAGAAREDLGEVSRQAVYDGLREGCRESGGALPAGGFVSRYEARVGDNHHHVACRSCGADVDRAVGYTACGRTVDDAGSEIDETGSSTGPMSQRVAAISAASGG